LTGTLPDLNLPQLQKLSLYDNNQLSGSIPNFNLPQLQYLILSTNFLNGSIPDFTNLPKLLRLNLGANKLGGSIPDFNLPQLQYLYLSYNQLSGSIPNFTNLPKLLHLYLFSNNLSGSIPNFTNLPDLQELYLSSNQLSGTIPDFTKLPNLQYLNFSINQLSGSIPNVQLPALSTLNLSFNLLSGTIPEFTYFDLSTLTTLQLQSNCGLVAANSTQGAAIAAKNSSWQQLNSSCHTLTVNAESKDNGSVDGGGIYVTGTSIELIATPNTGYILDSWSPSPCANSFTMPAKDLICTATFVPVYQLTTVTSLGNGSVDGGGSYKEGTSINLTATANSGYSFSGWSPSPCANSFTMPANDLTCTANFTAIPYTLTVNHSGNGSVGGNGSGSYTVEDTINLTATPDSEYSFSGWSPSPCANSFKMPANNLTCTATFTFIPPPPPPPPSSYQVQLSQTGSGQTNGAGTYTVGTTVQLVANPDNGYFFNGWSPNSCAESFTMPSNNLNCTANFSPCTYTLDSQGKTYTANADSGQFQVTTVCPITVTSNASWVAATVVGTTVSYMVQENTTVTPRTATLTIADKTFTITQQPLLFHLTTTIASEDGGTGMVSASGEYSPGDTVNLSAIPDTDSMFIEWTPAPCATSFTMPDQDLTCVAHFIKQLSLCSEVTEIPTEECQALIELYYQTNRENWIDSTDWGMTLTPCTWYGVTCTDNHVTQMNLSDNGLDGTIPSSLQNLIYLNETGLNLSNNQLYFDSTDTPLQQFLEEKSPKPVIESMENLTVDVGQSLQFQTKATNPNSDDESLTYSLVENSPSWATIAEDGLLTLTPEQKGEFSIIVKATDAMGLTSTQTFQVIVPNRPPILDELTDQTITVDEKLTVSTKASDPDDDKLTYSLENSPSWASIQAEYGSLTLIPEQTGEFSITVKVTDTEDFSDSQTFQVIVPNRPPILEELTDQIIAVDEKLTVSTKASDPDHDKLIYSLENSPSWASIQAEDGSLTLIPEQKGEFSITVKVTDAMDLNDSQTFKVVVPNRRPIMEKLKDQTAVVDQTLTIQIQASDPDNDKLTFSLENSPNTSVIGENTGLFTWSPTSIGRFTVTVKVTDNEGLSSMESFNLSVVNRPPKITEINDQQLNLGDNLSIQVTATDPDHDSITFSLNGAPATINSFGQLTWTPDTAKVFELTIKATDDKGLYDEEQFSVTVKPKYHLTTAIQPTEAGSINRSSDKSDYLLDETVTLTAVPANSGYRFVKWTGDCSEKQPSCIVKMNADKSVTAHFEALSVFKLTTEVQSAGAGFINRSSDKSDYLLDETVTLTAVPANSGYRFVKWAGDCLGDQPSCIVKMNADKSVTAHFEALSIFKLTTEVQPTGVGSIKRSLDSNFYSPEQTVTLTAIPNDPGYRFVKWTGDCLGDQLSCLVKMNANKSVTAHFEALSVFVIEPKQVSAKKEDVITLTIKGFDRRKRNELRWKASEGELSDMNNNNEVKYFVPEADVFYVWVTDGINFAWSSINALDTSINALDTIIFLRIIPEETLNLVVGEQQTISVRGYHSNGTWLDLTDKVFLQTDSNHIEIGKYGQITARQEGTAKLSATLSSDQKQQTAQIQVKVTAATPLLVVEPGIFILPQGASLPITVYQVSHSGEKTLYEQANLTTQHSNIATVEQGNIQGNAVGSTWLDVKAGNFTLSVPVVVRAHPKLDITPARISIERGEAVELTVTGGEPLYEWYDDRRQKILSTGTNTYQAKFSETTRLIVTDSRDNQATANITVVEPLRVTPESAVIARLESVTLTAFGGDENYSWTATQGSLDLSTGDAVHYTAPNQDGLYTVTVIDGLGKSREVLILVGDDLLLSQQRLFLSPQEGSQLRILGGVAPYQVTIEAGQYELLDATDSQNTAIINYTAPELAGQYTIKVKDAKNHQVSADVTVSLDLLITPTSSRIAAGEKLVFHAAGGVGTKRWLVTSGEFQQQGESIEWTAPQKFGTALIHVTDSAGAVATATVEISSTGIAVTPSIRHVYPDDHTEFVAIGGGTPYHWVAESGDYEEQDGGREVILYTAPSKRGRYQLTVQDITGKEAQAQANVYSTKLLVSPKTLHIRRGEKAEIAVSGGTGEYTLSGSIGKVNDTELKLTDTEVYKTTEYQAPMSIEGFDQIKVQDTAGNVATVSVEIARQSDVLHAYVGPDGKVDESEATHALNDFFDAKAWLGKEDLYWIINQFLESPHSEEP
jgi:Leucine-rich repeat (LRR) protein